MFKPHYGYYKNQKGETRIKILFYYSDGVATEHIDGITVINIEGMHLKHDRTNGHHMLKRNRGIEQAICITNTLNRQLEIMSDRGP